jgi:outer membrane protein
LSYTLFDGQLTNNKIIAENYRLESLKAEVASIEEKVIFDSIVAYLNVLRDIRLVELSAKNVSVLGQQLNAASSRFELGELTLTDVAQGTAALEAAKSVMAAREGALNLSNSIFEMAVGKKPTNLNQIIMLPKLPKSLNEAKILAAKSNADVRSILFLEQRARALWDVSKSKSLPSVGLSMSYSAGENYSNFDFSDLGFRISGSIPIYNGGSLKSGEKEAFLALESIMARSELVRLNVAQEVMSAWSTFEVSSAVISARTRQVEASELAFKGTAEEARLGARTILDVLNAEQALMNTKTDLETAQSDRLAAAYRLLLATGTLTPSSLGLVSAIDN